VMCISLKFHMMNSINWKKTQFTLSSTGASPRDLRYAVKYEIPINIIPFVYLFVLNG